MSVGELDTHAQPEVFYIDPQKGLAGLRKVLKLDETPRTIEGVDIAHLDGGQTVASLVKFIDGMPFKPGYRRYKIRDVKGIDDFRSIHEVVGRRFKQLDDDNEVFPDILVDRWGQGGSYPPRSRSVRSSRYCATDLDFTGQKRRGDLSGGRK